MSFPTYTLAGMDLDDPQGRWNLNVGTEVLPKFPGLEQASYRPPGASGETVVSHAPLQPATRRLRLTFHARDLDGVISGNTSERMSLLARHLDSFYSGIRLGATAHEGLAEVYHHLSEGESRLTWGRIVSVSEPEYAAGADYATLELLLQIPSARWYTPVADVTTVTVSSGENVVYLPAGNAPQDTIEINVQGRVYLNKDRPLIFRNPAGHGFRLEESVSAGDFTLIKPRVWGMTTYTAASPQWNKAIGKTGGLHPHNRPLGTGLAVYPSATEGVAEVIIDCPTVTDPFQVTFRARKAWF